MELLLLSWTRCLRVLCSVGIVAVQGLVDPITLYKVSASTDRHRQTADAAVNYLLYRLTATECGRYAAAAAAAFITYQLPSDVCAQLDP